MKVEIVGVGKNNSGTSRTTGKAYDMTPIYGICIASSDVVMGEKTVELTFNNLSGMKFPELHVGDVVHASHDQRGYLEELEILEKAGTGKAPKLNSGNA